MRSKARLAQCRVHEQLRRSEASRKLGLTSGARAKSASPAPDFPLRVVQLPAMCQRRHLRQQTHSPLRNRTCRRCAKEIRRLLDRL